MSNQEDSNDGQLIPRVLIVPAVMQLLGERAWWLPRWLRRRAPEVALERT